MSSTTAMEWVIFTGIVIILIMLIVIMVVSYRTAAKLQNAETTVLAVGSRVNGFLAKAEPVFEYATNLACQNIKPFPPFCPSGPYTPVTPK